MAIYMHIINFLKKRIQCKFDFLSFSNCGKHEICDLTISCFFISRIKKLAKCMLFVNIAYKVYIQY